MVVGVCLLIATFPKMHTLESVVWVNQNAPSFTYRA